MASNNEPKTNEECLCENKEHEIEMTIQEDIKHTAIMLSPFIILKLLVWQPLCFLNSYIYSSIEINNKLINMIHEVNKSNKVDSLKIQ
jgi:hypothetical protein